VYSLGDLGQGVRVALFELEPNLTSDIAAYEACYGLQTLVTYIAVDGGAGSGAGSGEAALDIEDVMGLAPNVAIARWMAHRRSP
jgi:subtilase family serine protease